MRAYVVLAGAALSLMGLSLHLAVDQTPKPGQPSAKSQPERKTEVPAPKADAPITKPADKTKTGAEKSASNKPQPNAARNHATETKSSVPQKFAEDELAIRGVHEALVKAYSSDDAQGVAAHFLADAEYINAQGAVFQGREEIELSLSGYLADHPRCQLESEIEAIRFVSPTVALVDQHVAVTHEEQNEPTHCHSAAVYVKTDGKWRIASIRDQHAVPFPLHEEQLAQLDFLIGDWVDEDDHSVVSFSCRATDNGKFLLREFTLKLSGQDVLSGSQRIGWDPVSGQLRTWIFDSEGGFAEGIWQRLSDDEWVLKAAGVTSEGEMASGTCIYKIINDHTTTWQAVDHEIGGVRLPDSPVFTLIHRAPTPETRERNVDAGVKEKEAEAGSR